MRTGKFKVRKSEKNDKWYWKLVATNGETIAMSEPYSSKQAAKKGIRSVRFTALFASIVEE